MECGNDRSHSIWADAASNNLNRVVLAFCSVRRSLLSQCTAERLKRMSLRPGVATVTMQHVPAIRRAEQSWPVFRVDEASPDKLVNCVRQAKECGYHKLARDRFARANLAGNRARL